jgi:phospholipid-binding lipoprotein MlaA
VKGAPTISRAAAMLSCIALLAGCAAAPSRDDPFEPMNRAAYAVHEVVDGNIVKPIAQAYVDYTPRLVQKGISNFFGNIDDFFSFINGVLQNKPEKAGHDLGRVDRGLRRRIDRPILAFVPEECCRLPPA